MRVSFDFDSTLAEQRMKKLAAVFISNGHEVFITTSRMDEDWARVKGNPNWNKEVFVVAESLGIPKDRIRFTNGDDKYKLLEGFDIHFDDDFIDIELIEEHLPNCAAVLISDFQMPSL